MNKLFKLTKEIIQNEYLNKPILIETKDNKNWFIVTDLNGMIPLHMLNEEESDWFDLDESIIDALEVIGIEGKAYLMWIYLGDGWKAFGYE